MSFMDFKDVSIRLYQNDSGWLVIGGDTREDGKPTKIFYKDLVDIFNQLVKDEMTELNGRIKHHGDSDFVLDLKVVLSEVTDETLNKELEK